MPDRENGYAYAHTLPMHRTNGPGWQNEFNATSSDTLSAFAWQRQRDREREGERGPREQFSR